MPRGPPWQLGARNNSPSLRRSTGRPVAYAVCQLDACTHSREQHAGAHPWTRAHIWSCIVYA
eukprot:1559288-Alexandrium_andersonii.AAC.1